VKRVKLIIFTYSCPVTNYSIVYPVTSSRVKEVAYEFLSLLSVTKIFEDKIDEAAMIHTYNMDTFLCNSLLVFLSVNMYAALRL